MRAFVRHYVEVFNFAEKTGDVARLQALSARTCKGCERAVHFLKTTYENGGDIHPGDGWEILAMIAVPREPIIVARLHEDAVRWSASSSATPAESKAHRFALRFGLAARATGWIVTRLEQT